MNTNLPAPATPARLLKKPLVELLDRVTSPASLSKTLNLLFFEHLRKGNILLPDELDNLNALFDFLLACQVATGATVIVAEA